MKASLRDHLTILMAFAAVLLCGYGIGRLVAQRHSPTPQPVAATWEMQSLSMLKRSLELSPEEAVIVENEISAAASEISNSRSEAILAYHQHLDDLYTRLIRQLGEPAASRLRAEREELQKQIQKLTNPELRKTKPTEP